MIKINNNKNDPKSKNIFYCKNIIPIYILIR